jgi:hypothetical protein
MWNILFMPDNNSYSIKELMLVGPKGGWGIFFYFNIEKYIPITLLLNSNIMSIEQVNCF